MSGAMRRIGEYLGLLEETGRYEAELEAYQGDDAETGMQAPVRQVRSATVADLSERRRPTADGTSVAAPARPAVAELSRIITLTPTTYNEARAIGENYRDGTPVIMNLTEMNDADAKRLVDFAAGLIFATRGDIERITNKVFLLSPANVAVTAEDKARIAEGGFFNQS